MRLWQRFLTGVIALSGFFSIWSLSSCKNSTSSGGGGGTQGAGTYYTITKGEHAHGDFTISKTKNIRKNEVITLTIDSMENGYRFKAWDITGAAVQPAQDTLDPQKYTFAMPPSHITVNAEFINSDLPVVSYTITKGGHAHGDFTVSKTANIEKNEEITLTIGNIENGYRFKTWNVTGAAVSPVRDAFDSKKYTFAMPPSHITIDAEFVPRGAGFFVLADNNSGIFTIDGLTDDEAMPGAIITVSAKPKPGYKLVNGKPRANPEVVFTKTGEYAWTFPMPADDVSLGFEALARLELYKGGAKTGLKVAPLEDYPFYHTSGTTGWTPGALVPNWASNITLNAEVEGHAGNPRSLKVSRSALNEDSGFGLAFDTEFDMSGVKALSFWARTDNAGGINVKRFGFGDAGVYAQPWEWCGTHRGVLYTGEANNNTIPVTTVWKRFIVPVPGGLTAPDMKRVFTLIAAIPAGSSLYIDDIEFLDSGVTCTGIRVPNAIPGKIYPGVSFDVASLFEDTEMSWEFRLDEDNSTYRIYMVSDGGWYHLYEWPAAYKQFTIDSITGNAVKDSNTSIIGQPEANISLVLKNGQGVKTNPIAMVFDTGYVFVIEDFEAGAGSFNGNGKGYWHSGGEWAAGFADGAGESFEGKKAAWWSNYRWSTDFYGFGRNNANITLTEFDNISFWIKSDRNDHVFAFVLNGSDEHSVQFSAAAAGFWEKKAFTLAELGFTGGTAAITSWQFNWVTAGGTDAATVFIDYIAASKIPIGSSSLSVTLNFDADYTGFPEGITLHKTGDGLRQLDLSLDKYASAQWYVDGTWVGTGKTYTLKAADWNRGEHSLTMIVTINGVPYSKKASFTVEK